MPAKEVALLDRLGPVVDPSSLTPRRAAALAEFLGTRDDLGCDLVECRQANGAGWLVVDVHVDVGQQPLVDIRRIERAAIGFVERDDCWPEVAMLRPDFPRGLPHQFVRPRGDPPAICFSEVPWEDERRVWAGGKFIRLLRTWLIDTARGALHRDDQALEPFIVARCAHIVLPADFAQRVASGGGRLFGEIVETTARAQQPFYRVWFAVDDEQPDGKSAGNGGRLKPAERHQGQRVAIGAVNVPPRRPRDYRSAPVTLQELCDSFRTEEFDFPAALERQVQEWMADNDLRTAVPILLVQYPVVRDPGAEAERHDVYAFALGKSVTDVAIAMGGWIMEKGQVGPLLGGRKAVLANGDSPVEMMNPVSELSREHAAKMNGRHGPSGQRLFVVGFGALGSQISGNLLRMGETLSAVVDTDRLLPHNRARHEIADRRANGSLKVALARYLSKQIYQDGAEPEVFPVDVTNPVGAPDGYEAALARAAVILDFAASVPVSRFLCLDAVGPARRISAFLNPLGTDLVMLAESADRETTLEALEMNYYRAVAVDPRLETHFQLPPTMRYARSCREVTSQMSQAAVGTFAGIAAGAICRAMEEPASVAALWRLDLATFSVTKVDLETKPPLILDFGRWTILVTPGLLEEIQTARSAGLPAETGGILLGDVDTERQRISLVAQIPAPADSIRSRTTFIRGCFGLHGQVRRIEERTLNMLRYVGEWHSHPEGSTALPSGDDRVLYAVLAAEMAVEGFPGVMAIMADTQLGIVVSGAAAIAMLEA